MTFLDLIGPGRMIDPAVIQASAARGDDWYPYAARMPLPEASTQPRGDKTTFILHSMAGPNLTSLEALWTYMNRTDITGECTWVGDLDGRVAQTVPVNVRADNNYRANPFATSIETQDRGAATLATTPWSDPLMAQLAGLSAWQVLHPKLDIPLRRADQGWNGGGIDGHRRYAEWSKYIGKTCPGQARWEQIDDVLAGAQLIVEWRPTPDPVPIPESAPPPIPITDLEEPSMWLIGRTSDTGDRFLASPRPRGGAFHVPSEVPGDYPFAAGGGQAFDVGSGTAVSSWGACKKVPQAQLLAVMGAEV